MHLVGINRISNKVGVGFLRRWQVLLPGFLVMIIGCGSHDQKDGVLSGTGQVNDLSADARAAAAISAQTETENGRAPGACVEILFAEARDVFVNVSSDSDVQKMRDAVCSLDDQQMGHLLSESHARKGTRSDGFGLMIDTLTQYGKNMGELNYNRADTQSYHDALIRADVSHIRHAYCEDRNHESYKSSAVQSFKSIASEVTIDKYNACVRAKSYGLRCDATAHADHVAARIRWEPTELVRSYLPRVALDWSGLVNLKSANELPKTLGIGSGLSLSLTREKSSENSAVSLTAQDRSGNYNFTCQVAVPAEDKNRKLTRRARHLECGVELFKEMKDPLCGVAVYKTARTEACGVELFADQRSPSCGVEHFLARHDCDLCGQVGSIGGCRKCEHPSFGISSYRSCRHVSHGVDVYKECRHIDHGAESYNSCRRQEFGVEQYKECELPLEEVSQ